MRVFRPERTFRERVLGCLVLSLALLIFIWMMKTVVGAVLA